MDEIRKILNDAYEIMNAIMVSGQSADYLVAAKHKIRTAFQLCDEEKDAEKEGQKNGG